MKNVIQSYYGTRLCDVPKDVTCGLYLLRSATNPSYYRMGESAAIKSRLGTHGGKPPRGEWKKAPNFAETFRPWEPIWIATIGDVTKLARVACEHLLFATFAAQFPLVDESAFEAKLIDVDPLVEIAESAMPGFSSILLIQNREKFNKTVHWGMPQ